MPEELFGAVVVAIAAAFDEKLAGKIRDCVGTEDRVKYNEFSAHHDRDIYKGLTFWSSNVNIFREPCCGSETLIRDMLRGKWNFEGHFVSDCWAIKDFHENHMVTATPAQSAAMAQNAGCDLN